MEHYSEEHLYDDDYDMVGEQEDQVNEGELSEPFIFKTLANKVNCPRLKSFELCTFQEDLFNSTTTGHQNDSHFSDYNPQDMFYPNM